GRRLDPQDRAFADIDPGIERVAVDADYRGAGQHADADGADRTRVQVEARPEALLGQHVLRIDVDVAGEQRRVLPDVDNGLGQDHVVDIDARPRAETERRGVAARVDRLHMVGQD